MGKLSPGRSHHDGVRHGHFPRRQRGGGKIKRIDRREADAEPASDLTGGREGLTTLELHKTQFNERLTQLLEEKAGLRDV